MLLVMSEAKEIYMHGDLGNATCVSAQIYGLRLGQEKGDFVSSVSLLSRPLSCNALADGRRI